MNKKARKSVEILKCGQKETINFRHFLLNCNPFWCSEDFLDTIGPSRSLCWAGPANPPPSRGSWQFKSLSSWAKAKTFRRPRKQRACDLTTFFGFNKFSTRIRQDIFWRKSGVRICQILHCAALTRIFNFLDFHFLVLQKKKVGCTVGLFSTNRKAYKGPALLKSAALQLLFSDSV